MWVCLCEAVNSSTIKEVIAAGARTTEQVGKICRAGTICGRCRKSISALLNEAASQQHRENA
jgi:bacterioferritin-associated ferredoxin